MITGENFFKVSAGLEDPLPLGSAKIKPKPLYHLDS